MFILLSLLLVVSIGVDGKPSTKGMPSTCPAKENASPDEYSVVARTLKKQGAMAAAVDCLEKAIALNPRSEVALLERAEAATMQKDYLKAAEIYRAILKETVTVTTLNNLAIAYSELGKNDEAIDAYERAIRLDPDDGRQYYNLGTALERSHRYKEAAKAYEKALVHEPEEAKYYNNLGGALGAMNKTETAVRAYKWAIKLNKKFVDAYYNLGNLYLAQGKIDESIEELEKALKIDKKHQKAKKKLAEANKKLEEKVQAFKEQIDQAIEQAQKMR